MSTHTSSSGFDGPPCGPHLLSALILSAMLAGCSHAPPQSWRVEPVYRVADSDARSAAQGYRALARQYEGEGRLAQAAEAQRRAALADPADAQSLHALGVKLARHGELSQGVAALRLANEMAPGQPRLLNNLGYALQLSDQPDQAQAMYEAALLADPNYDHARKNLRKLATASRALPEPPPSALAPEPVLEEPERLQLQTLPNLAAMTVTTADDSVAQPPPVDDMAPPLAAVDPATGLGDVRVEIINGNGLVGAAGALRNWLGEQGVKTARLANMPPYDMARTVIVYSPGHAAQALELARRLPLQSLVRAAPSQSPGSGLRVVLGHDLRVSAALHQLANQANAHPALKKAAARAAAVPADAGNAMQRSLARR